METRRTINKDFQSNELLEQRKSLNDSSLTHSYSQSSFLCADSDDEVRLERDLNIILRTYKENNKNIVKETLNKHSSTLQTSLNNTEKLKNKALHLNSNQPTKNNNNELSDNKKYHTPWYINGKTGKIRFEKMIFERYLSLKKEDLSKLSKNPNSPLFAYI